MPGDPTIEERCRVLALDILDGKYLSLSVPKKIEELAREYAEERTEPLVVALAAFVAAWDTGKLDGSQLANSRAALAAEEEARRG